MFTPEERSRLRQDLLDYASRDGRISGAAITGSAAADSEDQWSDIDLAFGVREADGIPAVLNDWTAYFYQQHEALHHTDVRAGHWIYRVFLLRNTLQVDVAFAPAAHFRALAPTFRLVWGEAGDPAYWPPPAAAELMGMAWLHALHARSAIARGRLWQAEYMISGVRGHALAMACIRHGLPAAHGRGMDQLPDEIRSRFAAALVGRLDLAEVSRAFRAAIGALTAEIRAADAALAVRLENALTSLAD
jgi:hypothetical protein